MLPLLEEVSGYFFAIGAFVIPALASVHIISNKHDVRAAIGWAGLVWLIPFFGTVLYLMFGINRIRRKALRRRRRRGMVRQSGGLPIGPPLPSLYKEATMEMAAQAKMLSRRGNFPLTAGNSISYFSSGEEVYNAMLQAIEGAKNSVALATYIFERSTADGAFIDALSEAVARGVEVRVLVDGVGALYHRPAVTRVLTHMGVKAAQFNRKIVPWRMPYLNLRNHRKIMVVDGIDGFTGGMNLRQSQMDAGPERDRVRDLHFRLKGPVVAHLSEVFSEDWSFVTGELLEGEAWFPMLLANSSDAAGEGIVARGIPDGPDEDMDKLVWTILGALGMARRSIAIQTPYLVPDRLIVAALNHAAMRGVKVDILLPEKNNLRVVGWASRAHYRDLLAAGCRIHHLPPPFDHSKILLVDGVYALFGSSNWDARSLRLNFEFNVECYSSGLASGLGRLFSEKLATASPVTLEDCAAEPAWRRARNGLAWLTGPYL